VKATVVGGWVRGAPSPKADSDKRACMTSSDCRLLRPVCVDQS